MTAELPMVPEPVSPEPVPPEPAAPEPAAPELDAAPPRVRVTYGTRTDVGLKRAVNEDSLLAEWPVFLVAGGMGGHDAGDAASAAVIAEFRTLVGQNP